MEKYNHRHHPDLKRAAKITLDNQEFIMLLEARARELTAETMSLTVKDEVMAVHGEFQALENFKNWIEVIAEEEE